MFGSLWPCLVQIETNPGGANEPVHGRAGGLGKCRHQGGKGISEEPLRCGLIFRGLAEGGDWEYLPFRESTLPWLMKVNLPSAKMSYFPLTLCVAPSLLF